MLLGCESRHHQEGRRGGWGAVGPSPPNFGNNEKKCIFYFFTNAQSRFALVGFDNYLGRPRRVPWSCWDEQKRKVFPCNERFLAYLPPPILTACVLPGHHHNAICGRHRAHELIFGLNMQIKNMTVFPPHDDLDLSHDLMETMGEITSNAWVRVGKRICDFTFNLTNF